MKTKDAKRELYQTMVYHLPKPGPGVSVIREGETVIVRRRIDRARSRAAIAALRARIARNRKKRSGPTATEIIREIRDTGRY